MVFSSFDFYSDWFLFRIEISQILNVFNYKSVQIQKLFLFLNLIFLKFITFFEISRIQEEKET
jgi:hypothetical protein